MGVPNTGGQLRTRIQDMQVGDYIKASYTTGTLGTNIELADKGYAEYPLTGSLWSSAPNGFFYFIKVDGKPGSGSLYIADRVIFHSVAWNTLNSNDLIQGRSNMVKDHTGVIRSLGGGNSYAGKTNLIPKMTSNTAPSGVVSASSEYSSLYAAYFAFDRGSNSWVSLDNQSENWIAYDFGKKQKVTQYAVTSYNHSERQFDPKSWTFEGWDGVDWVALDNQVNQSFTASAQKKVYTSSVQGEFSKYRLKVSAINGSTRVAIGELEMFDGTAISSLTDQGLGAWPQDNEYDKYIVGLFGGADDVWHWSNVETICQDTLINGIFGMPTANTYRTVRGYTDVKRLNGTVASSVVASRGFRPCFEYQEVTP